MCKLQRSALMLMCLLCGSLVQADELKKLQGVWRITERIDAQGVASKSVQPSQYIFTAKHFSVVVVLGETARPDAPQDLTKATAQELGAAWGPFVANAGTYEVKGNEITTRPTVAKNPQAMKVEGMRVYSYTFEGETLVLKPIRGGRGPLANEGFIKLVRLE